MRKSDRVDAFEIPGGLPSHVKCQSNHSKPRERPFPRLGSQSSRATIHKPCKAPMPSTTLPEFFGSSRIERIITVAQPVEFVGNFSSPRRSKMRTHCGHITLAAISFDNNYLIILVPVRGFEPLTY